jgi:preprotein translocase subunit YajC
MSFFISSAYGQAADAAAAAPAAPTWTSLLLPLGFVVIFYFLIWRPQSKRAKELKALADGLGVGDEVMTNAGILGKLTKIDDLYVTVQVADKVELKMQKSSIAAVLPKGTIKSI